MAQVTVFARAINEHSGSGPYTQDFQPVDPTTLEDTVDDPFTVSVGAINYWITYAGSEEAASGEDFPGGFAWLRGEIVDGVMEGGAGDGGYMVLVLPYNSNNADSFVVYGSNFPE